MIMMDIANVQSKEQPPSNSSWHTVPNWYVDSSITYDEILKDLKEQLDYEYKLLPDSHQVIYYKLSKNTNTGKEKWDIYFLY